MTPENAPYELTWRQLTAEELTHVCLNEMRRTSPPEAETLSTILNGEAAGFGHTWGACSMGKAGGLPGHGLSPGSAVSQLDFYFAVVPDYRAAGLGAQLLESCVCREKGVRAIMIESECPEKAEDEAILPSAGFYARQGGGYRMGREAVRLLVPHPGAGLRRGCHGGRGGHPRSGRMLPRYDGQGPVEALHPLLCPQRGGCYGGLTPPFCGCGKARCPA